MTHFLADPRAFSKILSNPYVKKGLLGGVSISPFGFELGIDDICEGALKGLAHLNIRFKLSFLFTLNGFHRRFIVCSFFFACLLGFKGASTVRSLCAHSPAIY